MTYKFMPLIFLFTRNSYQRRRKAQWPKKSGKRLRGWRRFLLFLTLIPKSKCMMQTGKKKKKNILGFCPEALPHHMWGRLIKHSRNLKGFWAELVLLCNLRFIKFYSTFEIKIVCFVLHCLFGFWNKDKKFMTWYMKPEESLLDQKHV